MKVATRGNRFALQAGRRGARASAGHGIGLEHVEVGSIRIFARLLHSADDVKGPEVHDLDGHVRAGDKTHTIPETLPQIALQLCCSHAVGGHIA